MSNKLIALNTVHIARRVWWYANCVPIAIGTRISISCPSDRNARLTARLDEPFGQGRAGSPKSAPTTCTRALTPILEDILL